MLDKIKDLLNKKHLLITGKTAIERHNFIKNLISKLDFEVFHFPSNMVSYDEYLDFVKSEKLYRPWYDSKIYNGN